MKTSNDIRTQGVSIVLGTYNRKSFLKLTIESIRDEISHAAFPCEIIVVDGGSTDGTLRWLAKQKDIITIIQHNRGNWKGKEIIRQSWGHFMNLGFRCAQGKYICMLSDDCLVIPGAIINGYTEFESQIDLGKNVGAMAFFWRNWPVKKHYSVTHAKNNATLVNHGIFLRKALEEVEYIDEQTYFFYHADSDVCLRLLEKGYQILESSDSYIEHYSHANLRIKLSNTQQSKQDWQAFYTRWKDVLNLDENDSQNSWLFTNKEYEDPKKTYKKFSFLHLMNSWVFLLRYVYLKTENSPFLKKFIPE
jgi:glycosyltransferase involved in cell wall biosynthesis